MASCSKLEGLFLPLPSPLLLHLLTSRSCSKYWDILCAPLDEEQSPDKVGPRRLGHTNRMDEPIVSYIYKVDSRGQEDQLAVEVSVGRRRSFALTRYARPPVSRPSQRRACSRYLQPRLRSKGALNGRIGYYFQYRNSYIRTKGHASAVDQAFGRLYKLALMFMIPTMLEHVELAPFGAYSFPRMSPAPSLISVNQSLDERS